MTEPVPAAPRPSRRWVWFRRLLVALAALGIAGLLSLVVGWIWLQSPAGNRWLLAQVQPLVQGILHEGTFEVGALETNIVGHLEVRDVRLRDAAGTEVIGADRITIRYALWALVGGTVQVRDIDATGIVFDVSTDDQGLTSLHHLFGPPDPDAPEGGPWEGLPVDVVVGAVRVDESRVRWATATGAYGVEQLSIRGAASLIGKRIAVEGLGARGTLTDPRQGPVLVAANTLAWDGEAVEIGGLFAEALGNGIRAGGTITGLDADPTLAVTARLVPADLVAIDDLLGGVGLGGRWQGAVWGVGPLSALAAHVDLAGVDGAVGRLGIDATADLASDEIAWKATIEANDLHAQHAYVPLATMVAALGDEVIANGTIEASGHGTKWPDGLVVDAHWVGGPQRVFGMDFDAVVARLGLAGGVLRIDSLVTSGPMGDLVGDGSIDLAQGPLDLHLKGPFVASELHRFGADGFSGSGWLDARFTGDPRAEDPVYVVRGHVVANGLGYGPEIAVGRAEGDVGVRIDARGVRVTADIAGTGGEAYGVAFADVHEPVLVVDYRYTGDLEVSGAGTVQAAAMPGVVAIASANGPWSYTMPKGAEGVFETHLALGAFEIVDVLKGNAGLADVVFADDRVAFSVALADGPRTVVDTVGTFATADSAIVLERLGLSPAEGYRYDAIRPVRLRLSEGGIADADIALGGADGESVEILGAVGTTGPLDAHVELHAFDVGVLSTLFDLDLSGTVSLAADLGGTADQAEVKGTVAFDGRVLEDQSKPLRVSGTFEGAADVVAVALTTEVGRDPFVDVAGTVPLRLDLSDPGIDPAGTIDLVADLLPGRTDRIDDFVSGVPNGDVSARVEIRGAVRDPTLRASGVAEAPIEGWDAPVRVEFGSAREDGQLRVWADAYEGHERRGRVDGLAEDELRAWFAWALGEGEKPDTSTYGSLARSIRVDAELLGLPVESLLALAGQDIDATGRVEGDLSVSGSPDTPVIRSDIDWVDGTLGGVTIERGEIRLDPVDQGYTLEADLKTPEGGLHLGGDVPIYVDLRKDPSTWGTGDLALKVEADRLPLGALAAFVPDVEDASGFLTMDGEVVGPATDPRPSLELSIADGSLSYLPLGIHYDKINLRGTASRDAIDVQSLTLDAAPIRGGAGLSRGTVVGNAETTDRPDLALSGRIGIADWAPEDVNVDVVLAGFFAVALPDQMLVVDGKVSTSGPWPDLQVRGDVTVQSGFWRLDAASFLDQGPLALDQRMVVHRGGQSYERGDEDIVPPIWHSFDVAVAVEVTRNLELNVLFPFLTGYGNVGAALTTANVNARLSGDLDLKVRRGDIDLRGEVEIIEGKVKVLRSSFDLQTGRVTFQGNPADPFLDLSARMDVTSSTTSGAYVEMGIRGLTSQPTVDFSSPDYPSDSQILTILITGQPPDDLSPEEGFSATKAMMNLLLTTVLGGARLGTVTVDADGTVRIGLPLGRVYAEAVYRLDPEIDENHYAMDFEIQLARKFLLDGTLGDRESMLDLLWELRF